MKSEFTHTWGPSCERCRWAWNGFPCEAGRDENGVVLCTLTSSNKYQQDEVWVPSTAICDDGEFFHPDKPGTVTLDEFLHIVQEQAERICRKCHYYRSVGADEKQGKCTVGVDGSGELPVSVRPESRGCDLWKRS